MYCLTLPGGVVLLHDSAHKLPESRRVQHDYYSLIDSAIGSSLVDVDRHFEPLQILLSSDEIQAQLDAINNLRYLLYNILHKQLAPNVLALCCLVESVDEEKWSDFSPEGLEELALRLSKLGLSQEHTSVTKPLYAKLLAPLQRQFPAHFPDTSAEQAEQLQRVLLLQIDEQLDPDDETLDPRRKSLHADLLDNLKPPTMAGPNNQPDQIRSVYRSNLISLQLEGLPVTDDTPSYLFWEYITTLEEKYRRQTATSHAD